tara:strand:+ start:564 stop:755 length:192 start_codon:yes stop_codon:yes gene_type:complete
MMIDKEKLLVAVNNLIDEEMISEKDLPTIKSWVDNRNYADLYGSLKYELADSDIYYNGGLKIS